MESYVTVLESMLTTFGVDFVAIRLNPRLSAVPPPANRGVALDKVNNEFSEPVGGAAHFYIGDEEEPAEKATENDAPEAENIEVELETTGREDDTENAKAAALDTKENAEKKVKKAKKVKKKKKEQRRTTRWRTRWSRLSSSSCEKMT